MHRDLGRPCGIEKCGAVLSAEYVLSELYKEDKEEKIRAFEKRFIEADKGSVQCVELRGRVPGSCRACVTDAAKILETMCG